MDFYVFLVEEFRLRLLTELSAYLQAFHSYASLTSYTFSVALIIVLVIWYKYFNAASAVVTIHSLPTSPKLICGAWKKDSYSFLSVGCHTWKACKLRMIYSGVASSPVSMKTPHFQSNTAIHSCLILPCCHFQCAIEIPFPFIDCITN